jgi:hypothetical protein
MVDDWIVGAFNLVHGKKERLAFYQKILPFYGCGEGLKTASGFRFAQFSQP